MSENLKFYLYKFYDILDTSLAFVAAYFSVVGGIFISLMPLPARLSASLFFGLNLFIFLWLFCIILGKKSGLKNPLLWMSAICFSVVSFLSDDKVFLFSVFLFIVGAYLYFSRDSLASLKLFERFRIKFNQQRSKYESTH